MQYVYNYAGKILRQYTGLKAPLNIVLETDILDDNVYSDNPDSYSVIKYTYDSLGQLTEVCDALGQKEVYQYDNSGRLINSTDRNGITHSFTYNLLNSPKTETISSGTDTNKIVKQYAYDNMNYLISIQTDDEFISYTYDARGQQTSETYENVIKKTTYNNAGMITGYSICIDNAEELSVSYEYNVNGQIKKIYENGIIKAKYEYDLLKRLIREDYANGTYSIYTYNMAGLPLTVTNMSKDNSILSSYSYEYYYDGNEYSKKEGSSTTTYKYDGLNRLIIANLPDGTVQEYSYDTYGNRISKKESIDGTITKETVYTYNLNNLLLTETSEGITTTYDYD